MSFDSFMDAVWEFDDYLWFVPFALIIALGLYSTARFKGIQFGHLPEMMRITFSLEKSEKDKVSPFQVFCMSMGNRIGVGNIAGPITALLMGGPGAILWMWVFATLGGATSFVETTVGQIFKGRDENGEYVGGPAYNVAKGLGSKKFGLIIAGLMIAVYIGGYVLSEISTISTSFTGAYDFEYSSLVIAFFLCVIAVLVILGGFKRVAQASALIVPVMALMWVIMCIAVIILHVGGIPEAISSIFTCAFNVPATVGGGVGAMLTIAMRRGIWSNEAGEGTITNISSSAAVSHPVKQGMSQSLGVLFDTLISTMTALMVLSFFADYNDLVSVGIDDSMALLEHVMAGTFGGIAPTVVFIFMFLFAITSFMGDYVIGANNLKFITRDKRAKIGLALVTVVVVFFSAYFGSDGLYAIMDVLLAICGTVNCIVMFKLGKYAYEAYQDYRAQKAAGVEDPVFHRGSLSDPSGVTEWDD
ncbi:MAG: alanine:cation symporter family protein [Candidatus Methanomethylophilaceae archaeon]|nr:alanine:cation symporter family protein [Candidatus Methanomethylophilaceae archaeon]